MGVKYDLPKLKELALKNGYGLNPIEIFKDNKGRLKVRYVCSCGNISSMSTSRMALGIIKSCGCSLPYKRSNPTKHNMSHTRLYKTIDKQRYRCENKNAKSYHNYGGRGVKFNFSSIQEALDYYLTLPNIKEYEINKSLEIDRIDNNCHYEVGNVRVVTKKENCMNKRTNIDLNSLATIPRVKKNIRQALRSRNIEIKEDCFIDSGFTRNNHREKKYYYKDDKIKEGG